MMKKKALLLVLPLLIGGSFAYKSTPALALKPNLDKALTVGEADPDNLNELQKVFYNLAQGNFSVEYRLHYASGNREYEQKAYYTEYAIETDGYFGFNSVAQGDNLIFPYAYDSKTGEVVSKAPAVDSYTGMRYTAISDYRTTFKNIDLSALPTEEDEDGYYTYTFGQSETNDEIMNTLCMLYSDGSSNPQSLRFHVVGNSLTTEGVGLDYGEAGKDTVTAIFSQVGKTSLPKIKDYLDKGGTAKDYISDRFVAFLLPYLVTTNFSVDVDLTDVQSSGLATRNYTKLFTDYSEYSYSDSYAQGRGYVQYMNTVVGFSVDSNNDVVFSSIAQADTSGTPMTDLWYEEIGSSFLNLTPSNFIGYMSEENGETVYHLTDSQLISAIANLTNVGYDDNFHVDEILVTVDDWDTHAFTAEFPYYSLSSHQNLGSAFVSFKDFGTTVNPAVDRLMYEGEDASSQNKDEFIQALNQFKTGRYRQYGVSTYYMSDVLYNPNYYYVSAAGYGYSQGGGGYLKQDGVIYDVEIAADETVTVDSNPTTGLVLPGTGSYSGSADDLGYLSHPTYSDPDKTQAVQEAMYNPDNYTAMDLYGDSLWVNTDATFNSWVKEYFVFNYSGEKLTPYALGFKTSLQGDDPSSKMNKVTAHLYLQTSDNYMLMTSFNFFDVGTAHDAVLDSYLALEK